MSSPFLGVGWKFPVSTEQIPKPQEQIPEPQEPQRGIAMAHYEESVRQSIWIILATARGERVMRPDFGCGIHELVFAVNNAATAGRAATEVREALIRWEPRIELLNVAAAADPAQPHRLLIEIDYKVRATNSRFNLVYPFYLE